MELECEKMEHIQLSLEIVWSEPWDQAGRVSFLNWVVQLYYYYII